MLCIAFNYSSSIDDLIKLISDVLKIEKGNINLFTDILDILKVSDKNVNHVQLKELPGDFPIWLEFFSDTKSTDLDLAKKFGSKLNTPVLFSDEELDPYSWFVWDQGKHLKVFVDVEFLDEHDGFKIEEIRGIV